MDDQKTILDVAGVCAILKACADARVAELEFGDLYVRFGTPTEAPGPLASVDQALAPQTATEIAEIQEQQAEKSLIQEEVALRDRQLAQMLIEDPFMAEQMLDDGDLIDDDADPDAEA
jgi:hypothetical protein